MSLNKHLYEGIHFTLQNISAQGSLLTNWQIKRKILTTEYSQIIKYFFNYKANILSWLIRVHLRWIKVKIILYRFISVVWLTNFLSEIRNLINPRWWVEQQFLSVKRCQNFLEIWCIGDRSSPFIEEMEGTDAVWVVHIMG